MSPSLYVMDRLPRPGLWLLPRECLPISLRGCRKSVRTEVDYGSRRNSLTKGEVMRIERAFLLLLILPVVAFAGDLERGLEALKEDKFDLAIPSFSACIREDPRNAAAYYPRGIAAKHTKEH